MQSHNQTRAVELVIAAVLAATPLIILPHYSFAYDTAPKIVVALVGASIATSFFLWGTPAANILRLWHSSFGRSFSILCGAQIASLMISALLSAHPALAWNGGNWRRFGVVSHAALITLALLTAASCSKRQLPIILRAATLSGIVVALYGTLQYFDIDPFIPPAGYHIGEGALAIVRPPSTLGHADYFGGYLLYPFFFGAALFIIEQTRVWKLFASVAVIACSIAIVLSGTRGAMLGLAAGAVSIWMFRPIKLKTKHLHVVCALCATVVLLYFSPAGLKLRARSHWALEDVRGGARLRLWRDSVLMARRHLLFGFGPETFGREFPRYQSEDLSRAFPDFYHESPHNMFIDALLSQGLPGLAILIAFAVVPWRATEQASVEYRATLQFLRAALIAGLISNLFVCFTFPGALYFYTTVALLVGLAIGDQRTAGIIKATPVARAIALGIGAMSIAMFLIFAVRLAVADCEAEQAQKRLEAGQIEQAVSDYKRAQQWHPAGSTDDLYFSRAFAAASATAPTRARPLVASQQALLIAQTAAQTSEEQQNAWYNLAEFYAARNNLYGVEKCLRESIAASPNWFKPHWALARVLLRSGRRMEALAEASRAAHLDGGKDAEIAKFLQLLHD